MAKIERLNRILDMLASDGHVNVEDVVERLGVSHATARRDLDALASQQLLTRTHGGGVSNGTSYDLPLRYKTTRNTEQKVRIADAVVKLVSPGDVIGLNGGTTTTEVARALAGRGELRAEKADPVTVVTNALNIANELIVRGGVRLVVLGGVPRAQSYELVGPLVAPVLDQLNLDVAVLGVDGFSIEGGACTHNEAEAEINGRIAARAGKVIVAADSSKLGRSAFARICPSDQVDLLVTDADGDPEVLAQIRAAGIAVEAV